MTLLAVTFSPAALSWCAVDRRRGLAAGKTCGPVASVVLDDCKSLQQGNNFGLINCTLSVSPQ